LAERDGIAFPTAEPLSLGSHGRAAQGIDVRAEALAVPASGISRPRSHAAFRQVPQELDGMPSAE